MMRLRLDGLIVYGSMSTRLTNCQSVVVCLACLYFYLYQHVVEVR